MRIVVGLIVVVVVLVAAVLFYVASSLDSLVKQGIETYGSQIVGAPVRVGSVEITLTDGRGTLRDLSIANPEGFSAGDALRLGEITLDIEPSSLTEEPYIIQQIRIIAPEAHAEIAANGSTNIDALRKNVSAYTGSDSDSGGASEEEGDAVPSDAPPPRLRIDQLTFADGKLAADATALGGEVRSLEIPPLELSQLGGRNGQPVDALAKTILDAYARSIARIVAKAEATSRAEGLIDEKIGGELGEAAKGLLDQVFD